MNQGENKEGKITREDVAEEYDEAMQETRAYLNQEQKEMLNKMENRYTMLETDIESFRTDVAESGRQVNQKMKEQLDRIREQQEDLRAELDTLSNSSEDAWKELKTGVDRAFEDLDKALEKARNEFPGKE
jgi:archaellum component FlaC